MGFVFLNKGLSHGYTFRIGDEILVTKEVSFPFLQRG